VKFWEVQNIEELLVNITLFVLRVWGVQYREKLILNVTVLFLKVWGGNIERNFY